MGTGSSVLGSGSAAKVAPSAPHDWNAKYEQSVQKRKQSITSLQSEHSQPPAKERKEGRKSERKAASPAARRPLVRALSTLGSFASGLGSLSNLTPFLPKKRTPKVMVHGITLQTMLGKGAFGVLR